jgi:hypothetical protein
MARNLEKIQANSWRKKVQFETTFVIATSSDSQRILNYLQDSKPNQIGTYLCPSRLIATYFPNLPELHFRQGVIHSALQTLH